MYFKDTPFIGYRVCRIYERAIPPAVSLQRLADLLGFIISEGDIPFGQLCAYYPASGQTADGCM